MKLTLITFYADADVPEVHRHKQEGFDWRWAIGQLERCATRFGYRVATVTDADTRDVPGTWLRYGNARKQGLMHWLLGSQAAAIAHAHETGLGNVVLISPDTLIAKPLDFLFGSWDVCLLTRLRPKPIVNSVIAARPSPSLAGVWWGIAGQAKSLPPESQEWGADIDAVVNAFGITPMQRGTVTRGALRVHLQPVTGTFTSAPLGARAATPLRTPLWDFKGPRKALMADYARML